MPPSGHLQRPWSEKKSPPPKPTEVDAEQQSGAAELQGDVVPLLTLSMEQDAVSGRGPEPEGDHILHDLHFLALEAVRDDTMAVETDHVGPWWTKERKRS